MRYILLAACFVCVLTIGTSFSQSAETSVLTSGSRLLKFTTREGTWMSCDVSPDGREIVFDLLGDLWLMPIEGGVARQLRGGTAWEIQPRFSPDGRWISFTSDAGGGDNIWVMQRDGSSARAVTKESFRLLNNAVWLPDSEQLIARKHFTGYRSLGAGELWLYHIDGGDGIKLTTRRTEQKDAGEPEVSPDGRFLFFSEDVTPGPTFEYDKDPHSGIYVIQEYDLETAEQHTLIGGPGGAVRPEISPDGRFLAFVKRDRFKTVLAILDRTLGTVRHLFDGLSKDQQETWAIFGVYPGFAWMPDGASIVVWAQGRFHRIDVKTGDATVIPMTIPVDLQLGETVRNPRHINGDTFDVRVVRGYSLHPENGTVLFGALGGLHSKSKGEAEKVVSF